MQKIPKVGHPATGRTTTMVRIPIALKPAVAELIAHYRLAKRRAWEAQDDDAGLVAAADAVLDRIARGEERTITLEQWEQRHGLGGGTGGERR